jgi:hypothetical protein
MFLPKPEEYKYRVLEDRVLFHIRLTKNNIFSSAITINIAVGESLT